MLGTFPIASQPIASSGASSAAATAPAFEHVLLLSPRAFDLATLSASSQVSSLPVANLQNQEPAKVLRTTSAVGQYVDFAFAEPVAVNAAALTFWQRRPGVVAGLSSAALWQLHLYAAAADIGVTPTKSSGWQSVWPSGFRHNSPSWGPEVALLRLDNDDAFLWGRIEITDPAAEDGRLDLGRLAAGRAVQFTVNFDQTLGVGLLPNDVQEPNGWGQIFTDPRPPNRQFDMPWTAMGQVEAMTIAAELSRLRAMGGDVFCFLEPAAVELFHTFSMQGLFTGRHDYRAQPLQVTDLDGTLRFAWGFTFSMIQKR